jgi:uncharacterized membrane protein
MKAKPPSVILLSFLLLLSLTIHSAAEVITLTAETFSDKVNNLLNLFVFTLTITDPIT